MALLLLLAAALGAGGVACKSGGTPVAAPSATTAHTSASPTASPTPSAAQGCPVDTATLTQAFQANTSLADAIVLGAGLRQVTCYQNYATALTTPSQVDAAAVLFQFDPATATWTAVTGGTDVDCTGRVPADVIPHLPGCSGR